MQIIKEVYTYGFKEKKLDKIIKKVKKGKKVWGLHLVVLPLFQDGLMEIYRYDQLLQPFYRSMSEKICVIGLAKNKAFAQNIVVDVIQGMCDAGVDFDVKGFLRI